MTINHLYAQGDDVILSTSDTITAEYIMDTYEKLGYEVHPLKTFISTNSTEFLRRSYEKTGVTGYIARSTVGIRFRNPAQEEPTSQAERVYLEMCQWNLISLRGAAPAQAAMCFLESVANQGLNVEQVINYILTPSAVGGGGMDPTCTFGRALAARRKGPEQWMVLELEILCETGYVGVEMVFKNFYKIFINLDTMVFHESIIKKSWFRIRSLEVRKSRTGGIFTRV